MERYSQKAQLIAKGKIKCIYIANNQCSDSKRREAMQNTWIYSKAPVFQQCGGQNLEASKLWDFQIMSDHNFFWTLSWIVGRDTGLLIQGLVLREACAINATAVTMTWGGGYVD